MIIEPESAPVRVVKVPSLDWQPFQDQNVQNPDLGTCPINGGRRIFTGKIDPSDTNATKRKYVTLVATVDPPIEGVQVYFKVWDVDDPFDQIHGPLGADDVPNVDVIDNNQAGPDNRPVPEGPLTHTATTGSDGTARWTITVSMQPGNNYRAAASAISDVFGPDPQVTQATADLLGVKTNTQGDLVANGGFSGYKVPVVWSEMLTVWRKLHVETDAMLRPTFAQNTIIITNWNEPRFPNGVLVLDIDDQFDDDCFESGYIRIQAAGFADLVSVIVTYVDSVGDDVVHTNISQADWGARPGTGTAIMSDDDLNEANFLAGLVGSDTGIGLPPNGHVGFPVLEDDESVETKYAVAYILPVVEPEHSSAGWPFVKNMEPDSKSSWSDVQNHRTISLSTEDYWTAYVLAAFQPERAQDADCGDTGTKGIATHNDGSTTPKPTWPAYLRGVCAIFKETLHDAYPASQEQRTIAHEMAHTLGVPHLGDPIVGGDGGLMDKTEQGPDFLAQSIQRLREYEGP